MTTQVRDFADAEAKLRRMLDAALTDDCDRPLIDLLRETADAATAIIGCRYAAIGVLARDGRLEHFIPFDTDGDATERVGQLPAPGGLLATVVNASVTVHIPDIALEPRTVGPPAGHPSIRTLLGVPIMLRGRSAGGLVLSEPTDRPTFTDADERIAEGLATAAAVVIEKARTAAENRRRDRWLSGAADLARDLLAGQHPAPLRLVAERTVYIADADLVSIMQPGPRPDTLVVTAAAGERGPDCEGYVLPTAGSLAAAVIAKGEPVNVAHLEDTDTPEYLVDLVGIDSFVLVPLNGPASGAGVLSIGRLAGRPAFSAAEMGMATLFAGQVALALELAASQAHRDQMALIEERERIARDLHDHVIQRLFAIGLTMQNAGAMLSGDAADWMLASVDDIDDTIHQIRATIHRLTGPLVASHASIRTQAVHLLDDLETALGFRPSLELVGPVDFGVGEDVIDDCIAVLREALTNVARHACAAHAEVMVSVSSAAIILEVRDDGRGIGNVTRRSGLANLRARAERRNGSLDVRANGTSGTKLSWSIPVQDAAPQRMTTG